MRMRQAIGAVMVALLVLASPLPAMCGQCQFAPTKLNCHASQIQSPSSPNTAPEMASEHCQHLGQHLRPQLGQSPAIFQPAPVAHVASAQCCQDRPCQALLDASAKMNRANSTRFHQTIRSAALSEGSGPQELLSQESIENPIGALPLIPFATQPLSLSLRI
jgi:hypothetical protein